MSLSQTGSAIEMTGTLSAVGSRSSRLIVIRGNSGSGKSTVAEGVRAGRPPGTVAVNGQDVIRRTMLGGGRYSHSIAVGLIDAVARSALMLGVDVVIEGILDATRYGEMLRRLSVDHRGVMRCYRYDLPFEETVRRHATKGVADEFGEAELRAWWRDFEPIEGLREATITQAETLEETVDRILLDCWPPGADRETSRA